MNFCIKRSFPKMQNNSLRLEEQLWHKCIGVNKLMVAVQK